MGKMVKRKRVYRKRAGYRTKASKSAYSETLRKKVTLIVPVSTNASGTVYTLNDNVSVALNLPYLLTGTKFYSDTMFNGSGKAGFQRFRINGICVEYFPNHLYLTNTSVLTSLPPLCLSLYADYDTSADIPDTASIIDQKDRFILLPQQSSRPQRKYWSFSKTVTSFGQGQRGMPLGSYINLQQFQDDSISNVFYPGLLAGTKAGIFNSAPSNFSVGNLVIDFYIDCNKPTR